MHLTSSQRRLARMPPLVLQEGLTTFRLNTEVKPACWWRYFTRFQWRSTRCATTSCHPLMVISRSRKEKTMAERLARDHATYQRRSIHQAPRDSLYKMVEPTALSPTTASNGIQENSKQMAKTKYNLKTCNIGIMAHIDAGKH